MIKILKYNESGYSNNSKIKFIYKNKEYFFEENSFNKIFKNVYNFLYKENYNFGNIRSVYNNYGKFYSPDDINKSTYEKRLFVKIDDDKYYLNAGNKNQLQEHLMRNLIEVGASDIEFDEFKEDKTEIIDKSNENDNIIITQIENPFKQSICVLGGSGVGKSVTIENILENEGHTFEYIIPTAATTGILAQFSPSKSTYVPSRLGNLLLQAANDPTNLYTAVFDEMHKSNVIEMINDELLQAISTKRNRGNRFISLDHDTAEMYKDMETKRGNIIIPDNFGFIFISSKPKVIANNPDFFNRVDIIILEEKDRNIDNSDELLDKVLSDEEKSKLSSVRND